MNVLDVHPVVAEQRRRIRTALHLAEIDGLEVALEERPPLAGSTTPSLHQRDDDGDLEWRGEKVGGGGLLRGQAQTGDDALALVGLIGKLGVRQLVAVVQRFFGVQMDEIRGGERDANPIQLPGVALRPCRGHDEAVGAGSAERGKELPHGAHEQGAILGGADLVEPVKDEQERSARQELAERFGGDVDAPLLCIRREQPQQSR